MTHEITTTRAAALPPDPRGELPAAGPERWRERIAESELFASLTDWERERLIEAAGVEHLDAGETAFRRGDPAGDVRLVLRGSLAVETRRSRGGALVMNVLGPGELFGEMAVIAGERRSATVTAIEPCELLVIPQAEFLALLVSHPALGIRVLGALAERLRHLSDAVAAPGA